MFTFIISLSPNYSSLIGLGAFSGKRVANIAAISEKCSNHWEIFVIGRREEPDGRPADYTRSSSAVISTNSRSRILLAILGGTIATGLKGLGTKNCIWCGTGSTVSALGVTPPGCSSSWV